jgi:hypothetical protein
MRPMGWRLSCWRALVMVLGMGLLATPGAGLVARAATPANGVINGTAPVTWDFAPVSGALDQVQRPGGTVGCPATQCDEFDLTLNLPALPKTFYKTHTGLLRIDYTYTSSTPVTLNVYATDPAGNNFTGQGGGVAPQSGASAEDIRVNNPVNGVWKIYSSSSTTPSPTAAHGVATLTFQSIGGGEPPALAGGPFFVNYNQPKDIVNITGPEGDLRGEPSIGVNPKTGGNAGTLMYVAQNTTLRINFNDANHPATATWKDVTYPYTGVASLDAMLYTDPLTGRTQVSQLAGACSISAYTDDDGANWVPSQACQVPAGADHQTIGGGPYAQPLTGVNPLYPSAYYYCSQNVAFAECARSDNGGLTYGQASPIYTSASCFGLHGHVKVAPDGTVYVPNKACGAAECNIVTGASSPSCQKGVTVSKDNGLTWTVYTIPDSHVKDTGNSDPHIGIGKKGTVYYGYDDRDGHPKIAVSNDSGKTWTKSIDVGKAFGIENSQFPEVVAGDDDRAAFSWIGTRTAGNDQSPSFAGVWYLYVSLTYDGGKTWQTVNATPNDPVQRGCVQVLSSCGRRNMLDFNDIAIDKQGRVIVAYTDGCAFDCEHNPADMKMYREAAFVRQSCGMGLYAAVPAFDGYCTQASTASAKQAAPVAAAAPTAAPLPNTAPGTPWLPTGLVGMSVWMALAVRRRGRRRA